MKSFTWPEKKEIKLTTIEKKRFRKEEEETKRIREGRLKPSEMYTAQLSGQKLSFDSSWRLFRKSLGKKEYAINQEELSNLVVMVKSIKPEAGSFFINNHGHVLVKDKEFRLIFAGLFNPDIIKFER